MTHVRLCEPLDCSPEQAPLFMGFSRQEYRSGLPFPSPGDLANPGIEPQSPALQADSLPSELPGCSPSPLWAPLAKLKKSFKAGVPSFWATLVQGAGTSLFVGFETHPCGLGVSPPCGRRETNRRAGPKGLLLVQTWNAWRSHEIGRAHV